MTCQVRMYCGLSVKINTHETPHGAQRLWTHFFAFASVRVVRKNSNTHNWSSIWLVTPFHGAYRSSTPPLLSSSPLLPPFRNPDVPFIKPAMCSYILTCVTPTLTSLLTTPPLLSSSPLLPPFRNPDVPFIKPVDNSE